MMRKLTKEELQFLPAALEIIETPPSPVGRALIWLLISLFVIALTWAVVGKTDEVAVAAGKVVPSGYTKIVQAEDRGIVTRIHVDNGSRVRQGDLLIELDTVITEADVSRLMNERDFYRLTLVRLTAEKEGTPFAAEEFSKDFDLIELERQKRLYESRMEDYASRLRVAEKSVEQAKEQVRQAQIQRDKLAAQVKMAKEREEKTRYVSEQGGVSHFTWQEYLERYMPLQKDLTLQQSEIARSRQVLEQTEAVDDPHRGLIYRVLLSSDKDYFMVENRKIFLIPGMAVTAEIKTKQKRVIEYFLDPFKTYVSEGFRER